MAKSNKMYSLELPLTRGKVTPNPGFAWRIYYERKIFCFSSKQYSTVHYIIIIIIIGKDEFSFGFFFSILFYINISGSLELKNFDGCSRRYKTFGRNGFRLFSRFSFVFNK